MIDSKNVLLGGTGAMVGAGMTGESLKLVMGNSKNSAWNDAWVEPLQKAMAEFEINTPQRIAGLFGSGQA
ncbi:hypothetical protein LP416_07995 [Polaromonas sp. P2-4]|nr:hypothetical protein LP416_07995 [Polaromonas sp. P2-4]